MHGNLGWFQNLEAYETGMPLDEACPSTEPFSEGFFLAISHWNSICNYDHRTSY
jgi:hypothetical protein